VEVESERCEVVDGSGKMQSRKRKAERRLEIQRHRGEDGTKRNFLQKKFSVLASVFS
jgi:hypothetical protein